MKYVITAKNNFDGVNNHVTDPLQRTEICTELIMTRLKAIELLNTGVISKSDTIVTRIDRKCLYENLFDRIIDYQHWCEIITDDYHRHIVKSDYMQNGAEHLFENKFVCSGVYDLVSHINEYDDTIPYKPFYQRFEQDKNELFNIELNHNLHVSPEPYLCILNRQTPNHPEKNIPSSYWLKLINAYIGQTGCNSKVYVFGERMDLTGLENHVNYVDNLKDWCTLLANSNCKSVVSTVTGGVYPIFFVGHDKSKLIIIDLDGLSIKHADSPSFYNECINFKKVNVIKLYQEPSPIELLNLIAQ